MSSKLSALLLSAGLFALAPRMSAQNPTTAQAQQMMQNPALLQQLRQRIMSSGLTPDQVRARLRAEGYPENLLDAYLPGATGGIDSTASTDAVFSAITRLGIADTTEVDLLRCGIPTDSLVVPDTLPNGLVDSSGTARLQGDRRALLRARCLAEEDSLKRRLKTGGAPDSGYTIFGLDFFRNRSTAFNPNLSGPVDANYRIHPDDQLALILTGDVEQSYSLPVSREGFIIIPQVGQVYVNNLTMAEVENALYARLGRVYSGVRRGAGATTHFYITPARL
ncbi:MAG: polysaccharide biosynthesis/export family protein, partial [Gemmatimonadaceae bacterium]